MRTTVQRCVVNIVIECVRFALQSVLHITMWHRYVWEMSAVDLVRTSPLTGDRLVTYILHGSETVCDPDRRTRFDPRSVARSLPCAGDLDKIFL
jgi:hypothetical protein